MTPTTLCDAEPAKEALLAELAVIEGRVRGLQPMVGAGAPFADIIDETRALIDALHRVAASLVDQQVTRCLSVARTPDEANAAVDDARHAVGLLLRT